MTPNFHIAFHTPFGWMRPVSNGKALIRLDWDQNSWNMADRPDDVSRETMRQITDYLAGTRTAFDLPLDPEGKSPAGKRWLEVMARIPYGQLMSYKEFAVSAGKPKAARAAGSSCASNPIPIIYPCHRVVKSDGSMGNYGGGSALSPKHPENLQRKSDLIALEKNRS